MGQKPTPQLIESKLNTNKTDRKSYYYLSEDFHNVKNNAGSSQPPIKKSFTHVNNLNLNKTPLKGSFSNVRSVNMVLHQDFGFGS